MYPLHDANFNVTALVDSTGTVVERYQYDPFGAVTVLDASGNVRVSGSLYAWKYLHQGGRLDSVTSSYHFRFRDYSPTLGRWINLDPIGFAAGDQNLYRAIGNNPGNGLDPNGLQINPSQSLPYGPRPNHQGQLKRELNSLKGAANGAYRAMSLLGAGDPNPPTPFSADEGYERYHNEMDFVTMNLLLSGMISSILRKAELQAQRLAELTAENATIATQRNPEYLQSLERLNRLRQRRLNSRIPEIAKAKKPLSPPALTDNEAKVLAGARARLQSRRVQGCQEAAEELRIGFNDPKGFVRELPGHTIYIRDGKVYDLTAKNQAIFNNPNVRTYIEQNGLQDMIETGVFTVDDHLNLMNYVISRGGGRSGQLMIPRDIYINPPK